MLGVYVVMGGPEPVNPTPREKSKGFLDGSILVLRPRDVAGVGRNEQDRTFDLGIQVARSVLPQMTKNRHVVFEREPWTNGSVVENLEVRERADDPALGPIGMHRTNGSLDSSGTRASEGGRTQGMSAVVPFREGAVQFDHSAVDGHRSHDTIGVAMSHVDHDVATPRLTDHDGSLEAQGVEDSAHVATHGGEVVSVVGSAAATVAPQIDGD